MMAHQAKWKALPAQHRKSVADAIELLEKRSFDFTKDAQEEKEARARLASQGVTWHPDFSAADQGAIREAALKTWDKIAAEAGKTGPEYRQRILKALGR
jgi:TRAP-type C4-dicarboxylate transport system substrate-binding protein